MSKSIAIFQADHSLQVHTTNVVKGLEEAGYTVDLFLYNCRFIYETTNRLRRVHDLSSRHPYWNKRETLPERILEAFDYCLIEPIRLSGHSVPSEVFEESLGILRDSEYVCFIGVEKAGFVWAACLAELLEVPVIYYSLELYPTRNALRPTFKRWSFLKGLRFLKLRHLEKRYHKKARATIIQDAGRASELMRQNSLSKMDNLFLPVSLPGPCFRDKSDYLRTVFNIPKEKKVILQFGVIEKARLAEEVALAAQTFPPDWVLIFHGPGDGEVIERVKRIDRNGCAIISDNMIPSEELDGLISSADVGLCFYGKRRVNDYLTGFSSEKLVQYLRCGIPVVTFDYPSYLESVGKNGCGVCISDLRFLREGISSILNNYDPYVVKAHETFLKHFEFRSQFQKVIDYICDMGHDVRV